MEKEPIEHKNEPKIDPQETKEINERMGGEEMMKVICMFCEKTLGYKKGSGVSHGLCEKCGKEHFPKAFEKLPEEKKENTKNS